MRQNKRVSRRRSVISMHAQHLGMIVVALVAMVIINMLAESSCGQLMKSIGAKDRILVARQAELDRVGARWEATKSTDRLMQALGSRGLVMTYAKANQIIHMDKGGRVKPGQRSVALARERFDRASTAGILPAGSRRLRTN